MPQQMFPMTDGGIEITAIESRGPRQPQAFLIIGIEAQGAGDQLGGFAFQGFTAGHGQHVGVIHQQVGAVRLQGHGFFQRGHRFGVTSQRAVGSAQHQPALGVIGIGFHAFGQLRHHALDLIHGDLMTGLFTILRNHRCRLFRRDGIRVP